jgi:hypothetical protein
MNPTRTRRLPRPDELRGALLATVDLLYRRRASQIQDGYIDGYVSLKWLEWNGGGLRLTATGDAVCRQLSAELA